MPLPVQQMMYSSNNIEPMQLDVPMEDTDSGEGGEVSINTTTNDCTFNASYLVENPTIDLEAYANNYTGLAKIYRLTYIADHCIPWRVEALKMALNYVKENTYNTNMYTHLYNKLAEALKQQGLSVENTIGALDCQWIEKKSKKGATKLEKLDTDLKNYKSNSIKESIRRGHDDLGDHYLDMGDMSNALKCYSRSRDYCTSGKHVLNMCMNVIKVSIYLQNWSHVLTYVAKAEATPEYTSNSPIATKLHCAAGLADLASKKYKAAAKHFLAANFDHFTSESADILSAQNVAVYGGLCALASFDRSELYKNVITSSSFKLFLELEPQLRDAIAKFYDSKYASCLSIFFEVKDSLLLDLYLAPHVKILYCLIRNRALVQYFSPYLSVDMNKMAAAFNTNVNALEDELMQLILDGQIQVKTKN
ncbi:COP9 signalosome complex subunit 1-like protein [Dinothrombium tinctorium]|uniref:COP9 signalosome complex subunit 1-like protein n=1 Tax=Dinothrombium tinctorium TaxID=1965070 RepID=A0A3S3PK59_9ACAR|nr:COP9 signalosome complex subunit 1-like protein [Dinothrombium tinctorium]RWS02995.1 COP9 signalosome complex subunit 1-like protein [Dinothrombium tinctorium]